jgi:IS30 family transposase
MTYIHLSQTERYQNYVIMKAGQTQTKIAHILECHKSTIGREVARRSGSRGYRARQAQNLSEKRSQSCGNAAQIDEQILLEVGFLLSMLWSTEQIDSQLPSATRRFTQRSMQTKRWVDIYYDPSAARSKGANALR